MCCTGRYRTLVVGIDGRAQRPGRSVVDDHHAAASGVARLNVELCVVGWQAVDLVNALLQITQIEQTAFALRKYIANRDAIGIPVVDHDFFNHAFNHQNLQLPTAQVLLRQVGAGRDETAVNIKLCDFTQNALNVRHIQAATREFVCDALAHGG